MNNTTISHGFRAVIGGCNRRISLLLLILVVFVSSGVTGSGLRARELGIGWAPTDSSSVDVTDAPVAISDEGMIDDSDELKSIRTKSTKLNSIKKKEHEPKKVAKAKKGTDKMTKSEKSARKLGIGWVPTDSSSVDVTDAPVAISDEGMVDDSDELKSSKTKSTKLKSVKKKGDESKKAAKAKKGIDKMIKSEKRTKSKGDEPTSKIDIEEAIDDGAIEDSSTDSPFTFDPTTFAPTTAVPSAGDPTAAPVVPSTQSPTKAPSTQSPTKAPSTQAPTKAPSTQAPTKAPSTQAPTSRKSTKAATKQDKSSSKKTKAPAEGV